jgi:Homeodomain-like domain
MATSKSNDPLVPCQPDIDKFLGLLSNPGRFTRVLAQSPIMYKKFVVRLSVEERGQLESLVAKGKAAARKLTRARILLKADCSPLGPAWSDEQISDALDTGAITVHRVRRSFVEGGLVGVLVRRPVPHRRRMLDGEQEAHLIALACGSPPAGRRRWTLRLLADRLIELGHVDQVSHETIRRTLKKTS